MKYYHLSSRQVADFKYKKRRLKFYYLHKYLNIWSKAICIEMCEVLS